MVYRPSAAVSAMSERGFGVVLAYSVWFVKQPHFVFSDPTVGESAVSFEKCAVCQCDAVPVCQCDSVPVCQCRQCQKSRAFSSSFSLLRYDQQLTVEL